MNGVDAPQFMSSQWHFAAGDEIPPYGVAEITSATYMNVAGYRQPSVVVTLPSVDNPERVCFTGPTGIKGIGNGLCHAENTGYARFTGTLKPGERYGVKENATSLEEDPDGDFIAIGNEFTSSGEKVALFYKLRVDRFCGTIRFEIVSVNTSTIPYSASVSVKAGPCGCTIVPEQDGFQMVTVWDALQCLLYDESPGDLAGRRGFAHYMDRTLELGETACRWEIASLCCL